jgi:uncharacterized protein YcbX
VSDWLANIFGKPYRLLKISGFRQPTADQRMDQSLLSGANRNYNLSFADMTHLLIASEASFEASRLLLPEEKQEEHQIECYRPNIIVSGNAPFAEDTWKRIQIGTVVLSGYGVAWRCRLVTVNQKTFKFDPHNSPVEMLLKYRHSNSKGCFGHWFFRKTEGRIAVGDEI